MTWADFIVRGTLVLAAGFASSYAFGRSSAALRHFVWTAAFVALLALPVGLGLGPKIVLDAWPATPAARTTVAPVALAPSPVVAGSAREAQQGMGWASVLGGLYLGGLLLVAARFVAGVVRTARMVRRARPAVYAQAVADMVRRTLGIGRVVRTLESSTAAVPMTWGTLRPVVLLPEEARHWSSERLHAVVLHELIHVRRHDLLAQLAAQAACWPPTVVTTRSMERKPATWVPPTAPPPMDSASAPPNVFPVPIAATKRWTVSSARSATTA